MPGILAVGGASDLAPVLRRMFLRGGADPQVLGYGSPDGADVYIHVVAGEPDEADEALLRRASRARVPAVAVVVGGDGDSVPYVLATDVVCVAEGSAFPLDVIARVVANRLGEDAAPLAARVPVLREPVCDRLIAAAARRNAVLALRGVELPVLGLVRRLAEAYGDEPRPEQLAAGLAAGFGLRALVDAVARSARLPRRLAKPAVAYAGTRLVGTAARRLTRPRAAAAPVAP